MAPLRHVSRRVVTLISVQRARVYEVLTISNRGVSAATWHASPSSKWRPSKISSFADHPRSTHRGFTASACVNAKPPSSDSTSPASKTPSPDASSVSSKAKDTSVPLNRNLDQLSTEKPPDPNVNPLAGMMFPWERAVLSGDRSEKPMSDLTKFYWVAFAVAVLFLIANRIRVYFETQKSKEELANELAANRSAMQRALEGRSFAGESDPFEGMEPHEIEAFLIKQAPDGDPYAGMTPEEINSYLHKQQEQAVKEELSMPKLKSAKGM